MGGLPAAADRFQDETYLQETAGASPPLRSHFSHSQLSSSALLRSQASHSRVEERSTSAELACIGLPHFSHIHLRRRRILVPPLR